MVVAIATFLLRNLMVVLMLAIGLRTSPAALRATWSERALVLRSLVVLELAVPVLALATVTVLPLGLGVTGVIALVAVCPGAPMIARRVHGRAVGLVILALVSALAPITVIVWLGVLRHALPFDLEIPPARLARITLLAQVLPLAAGVTVAARWPRTAARLSRVLNGVFLVGFAIALVVVLAKGAPALVRASPWAIVALAIVVLGSAALGHVAGGPRLEDRTALAYIAVLGNPALAAAVIAASYPAYDVKAVMAAYLIARALALVPYSIGVRAWSRRRQDRAARAATGAAAPPAAPAPAPSP